MYRVHWVFDLSEEVVNYDAMNSGKERKLVSKQNVIPVGLQFTIYLFLATNKIDVDSMK